MIMWRRERGDFSAVEQDLRNRVPNPHDLAEELRVAHSVWDDRNTPERDIPSKVEAACREANGLPSKGIQKYYVRCEYRARGVLRDMIAHINAGKSLEETEADIKSIGVPVKLEQFWMQMAQIAYLNQEMTEADFFQVALDQCRTNPALTEIHN